MDVISEMVSELGVPSLLLRDVKEEAGIQSQYGNWADRWLSKFERGVDYYVKRCDPDSSKGRPRTDHIVTMACARQIMLLIGSDDSLDMATELEALIGIYNTTYDADSSEPYYTVKAYLVMIGQQASPAFTIAYDASCLDISKDRHYKVREQMHPTFGRANMYRLSVLQEVIGG